MLVKSEGRLDFSSRGEEDKRIDHDVLEGEKLCAHRVLQVKNIARNNA